MCKRIRGGKSGRQKQRESDLKDEIAPLPADIATLDSQLCCAIWLQKDSGILVGLLTYRQFRRSRRGILSTRSPSLGGVAAQYDGGAAENGARSDEAEFLPRLPVRNQALEVVGDAANEGDDVVRLEHEIEEMRGSSDHREADNEKALRDFHAALYQVSARPLSDRGKIEDDRLLGRTSGHTQTRTSVSAPPVPKSNWALRASMTVASAIAAYRTATHVLIASQMTAIHVCANAPIFILAHGGVTIGKFHSREVTVVHGVQTVTGYFVQVSGTVRRVNVGSIQTLHSPPSSPAGCLRIAHEQKLISTIEEGQKETQEGFYRVTSADHGMDDLTIWPRRLRQDDGLRRYHRRNEQCRLRGTSYAIVQVLIEASLALATDVSPLPSFHPPTPQLTTEPNHTVARHPNDAKLQRPRECCRPLSTPERTSSTRRSSSAKFFEHLSEPFAESLAILARTDRGPWAPQRAEHRMGDSWRGLANSGSTRDGVGERRTVRSYEHASSIAPPFVQRRAAGSLESMDKPLQRTAALKYQNAGQQHTDRLQDIETRVRIAFEGNMGNIQGPSTRRDIDEEGVAAPFARIP
ncbi:hypothetical protein BJ912DRAFT_932895 [Pholiota molesta]|nr:hypothetical protein BJ912DRAFT_932895 [Pholiota molesta]